MVKIDKSKNKNSKKKFPKIFFLDSGLILKEEKITNIMMNKKG